jgi:pyruvate-ferredoxin/flavodoxin oxidoreductase
VQGISDGMDCAVEEARLAVDSGYWPLYRYNPALPEDGTGHHGKLQIDSKKIKADVETFLHKETR